MDIEKEREAFEKYIQTVAHPHRSPKVMFFTVNDGHGNIIYADSVIQDQWITWQVAKAKAIPYGYVLVPKEPTNKMLDAGYESSYDAKGFEIPLIYKAMIEAAQE